MLGHLEGFIVWRTQWGRVYHLVTVAIAKDIGGRIALHFTQAAIN